MNVKDLHLYPPEVQEEVRASMKRVAAGYFTYFPPDWMPQWLFGAHRALETARMWLRVCWRKVTKRSTKEAEGGTDE